MKQLFEYLISKENKNKIITPYTKKNLKEGDILFWQNGKFSYFMEEPRFKKILKSQNDGDLEDEWIDEDTEGGVLIYYYKTYNDTFIYPLHWWNDDLSCLVGKGKDNALNVTYAFPGNGKPLFNGDKDFFKFTQENLKKEANNRNKLPIIK